MAAREATRERERAEVATAVSYSAAPVGGAGGAEAAEVMRLERELRDTNAQLQLLQSRCEAVESKARAQSELHTSATKRLDEYNANIHELHRKLQDVEHEKKNAEYRAQRATDLDASSNTETSASALASSARR